MQCNFATILLLLGTAWCSQDLSEYLQNVQQKFNSSEELQRALKRKCEKHGGLEAYDKLETAKEELQSCIATNLNLKQIRNDILIQPVSELKEILPQHCRKVPIAQKCINTASVAAEACLEEELRVSLRFALNITNALAEFACFKNGDRILLFLEEGGVDCVYSKKEEIALCAQGIVDYITSSNTFDSSLHIPLLYENNTTCSKLLELQNCVLAAMETCDGTTPINFAEALFKSIRQATPCDNHPIL